MTRLQRFIHDNLIAMRRWACVSTYFLASEDVCIVSDAAREMFQGRA